MNPGSNLQGAEAVVQTSEGYLYCGLASLISSRKSWEQITSHLLCEIMLATTFHATSTSESCIYVNCDIYTLNKDMYFYTYKYIYTEQEQELVSELHLTGRALK